MKARQQLEAAIAALEAQRDLVGDEVTDAALAPLRQKLAEIVEHEKSLRQVTVLFLDVVGSTALSRRLDPEEIEAIIDGALKRLTAIVHDHMGRVLQYAGDSLLAVFGSTGAREDDAERAVHCGLALTREAQQIGAEVRAATPGSNFNVRVGIHTGTVLLGNSLGDVSTIRGIAVNIAARMEQTAPVGGVRISHETQRHVRGTFVLTDEPPLTVKGFAEPMRSHLVLGVVSRRAALAGRGIEGVAAKMIGRDAELTKACDAYEGASDGHGLQFVTVVGDPGIGKSRLLSEFEKWVERCHPGTVRLHARAQPYSNSLPYGLVHDLVFGHLDILDSDSKETADAKLAAGFASRLGEHGALQAAQVGRLFFLGPTADTGMLSIEGDGRQLRDGAFEAIARYLEALQVQSAAPLALLLDDLHWADDGSLDFINHLARACASMPMLILGFTRPEFFERRPFWSSGRENHLRIDLAPLSRRDSRQLVEALLARLEPVPTALRELVASSAEGNPYFAEELIGMLVDDGVIVIDGERWEVLPDRLLQARVPSTLAGVLQARLDALPIRELATLQHASIIGHVFWDEALQRMQSVESDLLESLVRRELANGRDTSSFDGTREYVFKHHLLHRVTYDSVLKPAKREQHRLAAEWLVTRTGERSTEFDSVIADHFEKAGEAASAVRYLCRAATSAWKAYALGSALSSYERALALMVDSRERFDVMLRHAVIAFEIGDKPLQQRSIEQLEQLAEKLEDDGLRAYAASFRTAFAAGTRDLSAAADSAAKALVYAQASSNTPAAIRAHNQWGYALAAEGQFENALVQARKGLALARSTQNYSGECSALLLCGQIAMKLAEYAVARGHFQAAAALLQDKDERVWLAWTWCYIAAAEIRIGHFARGGVLLEAAMATFLEMRVDDGEATAALHLGDCAVRIGRLEDATIWLDKASRTKAMTANERFQAIWSTTAGHLNVMKAAAAEAAVCYRSAVERFEKIDEPISAFEARAGLARLALSLGNAAEARAWLSPAAAHIHAGLSTDYSDDPLGVMLTCHEVAAAERDPAAMIHLKIAHDAMQGMAAKLEPDDQAVFLGSTDVNRRIAAAWAAVQHL